MAGRFPCAQGPDEFWEKIRNGENCISVFTEEELRSHGVKETLLKDPNYIRAAPVLKDIELFDASFFGLTPREAEITDPQHRLFFECCWEALENAGYDPYSYADPIGLFAGARTDTYLPHLLTHPGMAESIGMLHLGLGNDLAFMTSRMSYFLNLRGPSFSLHTACSTSLVAVHMACQSLLLDECKMAMAGGIAVNVPHTCGYMYEEGSVYSPDGYCRPLGAAARGTVFGSGAGVVVLKRMEDALADGDFVRAVIRGTAINNDGSAKASFSAPSIQGQVAVIKEALFAAGVPGNSISYVECHGTGTLLGDAIELRALSKAFGKGRPRTCALGSVKGNLGHLDAAAGIAGLIKVVLSLENKMLPPSLHFNAPNPQINFSSTPFFVNTELSPWTRTDTPLRAGVSSFGVGGTNAHVVLEEAPPATPAGLPRTWHLLTFSARTQSALKKVQERLAAHLRTHPESDLADIAYTLQAGRHGFAWRSIFACRTHLEAIEALESSEALLQVDSGLEEAGPPTIFLFPGQESRYEGMGSQLYREEPGFAEHFNRCSEILRSEFEVDLAEQLRRRHEDTSAFNGDHAWLADPLLFALEYSLAQLCISWGIRPYAMLGHGLGEYTAACLSGVMTLEEALRLVAVRSRLILQTDPGSIEREFLSAAQKLKLRPPTVPFISNVTGTRVQKEEAQNPAYWAKQMRAPMLPGTGLREALAEPGQILLEIGPGQRLGLLALDHPDAQPHAILPSMPEDGKDSESWVLLNTLGKLWQAGMAVNWAAVHAKSRRHRVPLPTYPFERKRYWIDAAPEQSRSHQSTTDAAPQSPAKLPNISDWFWAPSWKLVPPSTRSAPEEQHNGLWLVLMDDHGIGEAVACALERQECEVVRVHKGQSFRQMHRNMFLIHPRMPADYAAVLNATQPKARRDINLVHLWNIEPPAKRNNGNVGSKPTLESEIESFLYAVQAVLSTNPANLCRVWAVSSQLMQIETKDSLQPEKAGLLALNRVVPQEHPSISCRVIDIPEPEAEADVTRIADQVLDELLNDAKEAVVGYRGRNRWVRSFERLHLSSGSKTKRTIRQQGVYLILGGLGTVGLFIADLLARTAQTNLVLVSRSELPRRQDWAECLNNTSDPVLAHRLRMLTGLEESGAQIRCLSADISSHEEMKGIIEYCYEVFGRLDGVIHAAGITSGSSVFCTTRDLSREAFAIQAKAKIDGLYALEHALLGRKNLDFVLLISSNSSALGGVGFAAYAAGNSFLDAYTLKHASIAEGPDWICTNWDHWPEIAKKSGSSYADVPHLDLDESTILKALELKYKYAMTKEEAQEALLRILTSASSGQIFVATGDLTQRFAQEQNPADEKEIQSPREAAMQTSVRNPRPALRTIYVAPQNQIQSKIAQIWEEMLGLENIGVNDDFFELGGHSLLATKLVAQLRSEFSAEITLAKFFENPTIGQLAEMLVSLAPQATI
jgi:acyl transferase domain-containing protein/acyl carrier protein